MNIIDDLIQKIEGIQDDLDQITLDAVKSNEKAVLDLNRSQMYSGIKSDGKNIKPQYTRKTKSIKRSKGQPTDRVTLKDTGDFHNSVFISYSNDSFIMLATDSKTTKLKKKYGRDILGLTDQNVIQTSQIIFDDIGNEIEKRLFE